MVTAMISAFTQRLIRRDVAMTGEITLRGEVLPVGGVKEKVLAARQAKIRTIVLPKLNRRDVLEISPRMLHDIVFEYVETADDVLAIALLPVGVPPRASRSDDALAAAPREIRVTPEGTRPLAPRA
jgi:ATP-dependent Lon protease